MRFSPFDALSQRSDAQITWGHILNASAQRLAFWRRYTQSHIVRLRDRRALDVAPGGGGVGDARGQEDEAEGADGSVAEAETRPRVVLAEPVGDRGAEGRVMT